MFVQLPIFVDFPVFEDLRDPGYHYRDYSIVVNFLWQGQITICNSLAKHNHTTPRPIHPVPPLVPVLALVLELCVAGEARNYSSSMRRRGEQWVCCGQWVVSVTSQKLACFSSMRCRRRRVAVRSNVKQNLVEGVQQRRTCFETRPAGGSRFLGGACRLGGGALLNAEAAAATRPATWLTLTPDPSSLFPDAPCNLVASSGRDWKYLCEQANKVWN